MTRDFGPPAITLGTGAKRPQGRRAPIGGDAIGSIAEIIAGHRGHEAWWSPHSWEGDRRDKSRWQASVASTLDLDCLGHGLLSGGLADAAIDALRSRVNLLHRTPHGLRAAFVFSRRVLETAEFKAVAHGASVIVEQALAAQGVEGIEIDSSCTTDLSRLFFTPCATVRCKHKHPECAGNDQRDAEILKLRDEPWSPDELVRSEGTVRLDLTAAPPAIGHTSKYGAAAIRNEIDRVGASTPGTRNSQLNKSAYAVGSLISGGEIDPAAEPGILDSLFEAAKRVGDGDAREDAKIRDTMHRALAAGKENPRSAPRHEKHSVAGGHDDRASIIFSQPGGNVPMHELTAQALSTVASKCPDRLYVRGSTLVHTTRERNHLDDGIQRSDALRIAPAAGPLVGEVLGEAAKWVALVENKDGQLCPVEKWCPPRVEKAFCARGEWPALRPLKGVVEAPTMRPDGSILDSPGYDPATALIVHPVRNYPQVPDSPTQADACKAADELLDPFSEFPFESDEDRASLLAFMLTIAVRPAITGHIPLWMFLAPCFRAGKGLMVVCAVLAMTGMLPDLMPPPGGRASDSESETRKRITALLLEAARVVLLDNVPDGSTLRSESLAAALTADVWTDRKLGVSENVRLPVRTIWAATAVNASLWGDLAGRSLSVRIVPETERPEQREFTIDDLRAHVRREHPRLLTAALTIVRAHHVAESPSHGKPRLGDFEAWDARVRAAVIWATNHDPLATQERLQADSPDREELTAIFEAWWEQYGNRARTARQVCTEARPALRDAIAEAGCVDRSGRSDPKALGRLLRTAKGRVVRAFRIADRTGRGGVKVWWLSHLEGVGQQPTRPPDPENGGAAEPDGGDGGDGGSRAGGTHTHARARGCEPGAAATDPPFPPSQPNSHELAEGDDTYARAEREAIQWESSIPVDADEEPTP